MAVSKIAARVFYNHPNLETVRTSAPNIETYALYGCKKLLTVDLTNDSGTYIGTYAFNGSILTHLAIRSSSVSTLAAVNALDNTKVSRNKGGIYVPSNLVSSYKNASNWATYATRIFPITEFPKSNFDTISDSWSTILEDTNPASHYSIGDTKTLSINGVDIPVVIAAFNTDTLSNDNTKTARITWILDDIYTCRLYANSGSDTEWTKSKLRAWLSTTILGYLENSAVGAYLQTVDKTYGYGSQSSYSTYTSQDKIWIPSLHELGLNNNGTYSFAKESTGVTYSQLFNSSERRKRYFNDQVNTWWTRTTISGGRCFIVSTQGISDNIGVSATTPGAVFGFCTGVSS